ncbi:glycoside hydrolase family 99-like domain-containing protein [Pedobacter frigiditerrae]|uniref:glycosyltransferase WbsX family protein n=1 Tax=Pedobacter frigiditerrae TaxID=2530452 RepID=UPI002930BC49|nr:glycoside hydrolase family 99-like domain-containing protein [Pedobacter frigiditerrae]
MIKPIAIHLPQFHPFPENDEWWGKGFTEWTNVVKGKPLFEGHYQPHLPADLGFYDLRLAEARLAQINLAKEYGIYGFCYYHYWFNGKRLMQEPLDRMLLNKEEDFPFMLCWANENWTRRWDGQEQEVLMKQNYSEADDIAHIHFLINHFFSDVRYIKVDGKPFVAIYRPDLFPDISRTLAVWRQEALKLGLEGLHIAYFQSFNNNTPPGTLGFDMAINFEPSYANKPYPEFSLLSKLYNKVGIKRYDFANGIYSYAKLVENAMNRFIVNKDIYPGITPMWDNAARRKANATIFKGSTPELYGKWLQHIVSKYKLANAPNKYLFINAWNEWAEGNHLEPCQKWGKRYLEMTKSKIDEQ